jgi:Ca2+-binding EF-hand superfamily protein
MSAVVPSEVEQLLTQQQHDATELKRLRQENEQLQQQLQAAHASTSTTPPSSRSSSASDSRLPIQRAAASIVPLVDMFSTRFLSDKRIYPATLTMLKRVASSPRFMLQLASHMQQHLIPQYLAQFLPSVLKAHQLSALYHYIELQAAEELHEVLQGSDSYKAVFKNDISAAYMWLLATVRNQLHASAATTPVATTSNGHHQVKKPVIYLTKHSPVLRHVGSSGFVRRHFVVRIIPSVVSRTSDDIKDQVSWTSMDCTALSTQLQSDIADNALVPALVIATVGSHRSHHVDDLSTLHQICQQHSIWMHVEGTYVKFAASSNPPQAIANVFGNADSVATQPLTWFDQNVVDSPAAVFVLDKHLAGSTHESEPAAGNQQNQNQHQPPLQSSHQTTEIRHHAHVIGAGSHVSTGEDLGDDTADSKHQTHTAPIAAASAQSNHVFKVRDFVSIFRLWTQLLGHESTFLKSQLDAALQLCKHMRTLISSHIVFREIGPDPVMFPDVVIFKVKTIKSELAELQLDDNTLNAWIALRLHHHYPHLPLAAHRWKHQYVFFFQPLAVMNSQIGNNVDVAIQVAAAAPNASYPGEMMYRRPQDVRLKELDRFAHDVSREALLVDAALHAHLRNAFVHMVRNHPTLENVPRYEVRGFVGVGAFRYVPAVIAGHQKQYARELNMLTVELAKALSAECGDRLLFGAHSMSDGNVCIAVRTGPLLLPQTKSPLPPASAADGTDDELFSLVLQQYTGDADSKQQHHRSLSTLPGWPESTVNILQTTINHAIDAVEIPKELDERISSVIRTGIQQAEQRINSTKPNAFAPDNLLRAIPVVGSVLNWFAPKTPEAASAHVQGQTFDLRSGQLAGAEYASLRTTTQTQAATSANASSNTNADGKTTATPPAHDLNGDESSEHQASVEEVGERTISDKNDEKHAEFAPSADDGGSSPERRKPGIRRYTSQAGDFAGLALRFRHVSQAYRNVRSSFRQFAADEHQHEIAADKLAGALTELGATHLSQPEILALFKLSDLDGSHAISFREFLIAVALGYYLKDDIPLHERSHDFVVNRRGFKVVEEAFRHLDSDGSGAVDCQELRTALFGVSHGDDTQETMQTRFAELDFDKDGSVYFAEFIYGFCSWLNMDYDDEEEDTDSTESLSDDDQEQVVQDHTDRNATV